MSIQAYQKAASQAESPRSTEFRAFAFVTRALQDANEARAAGRRDIQGLAAALDRNRRLWTVLSTECASPDNALPQALRAQIISLAMFVDRHTSAVLRDGDDMDVLIEINRSMMQGLSPS